MTEARIALDPVVKSLTEGYSVQTKLCNRTWLTLAVVAAVVLLPNDKTVRQLPFGIGDVPLDKFYLFSFFLLAVLTMYFCQTFGQAINIYRIVHTVINSISITEDRNLNRQLFDFLSTPTFNRASSLPLRLVDSLSTHDSDPKSRLLSDNFKCWLISKDSLLTPFWIYYVMSRIVASMVLFGLPFISLAKCVHMMNQIPSTSAIWIGLVYSVGALTLFMLLHVALDEYFHSLRGNYRLDVPWTTRY